MQCFRQTAFIIWKLKVNDMKTSRIIIAAVLGAAVSMQSCTKDDGFSYEDLIPNAVVTVKPDGDKFYLQLDDNTVIYPSNMTKSPYGDKEVRAFTNYKLESQSNGVQIGNVLWLKALLTKQTVASEGAEKDVEKYGSDPVEIIDAFPTVCEDGYLTLRFRALWSRFNYIKHEVNLVTGVDPSDPYVVEFRHNDHGDIKEIPTEAYVAFRLNQLPDTEGKTVKLKVRYNAPSGKTKTIEFNYKTRPGDGK